MYFNFHSAAFFFSYLEFIIPRTASYFIFDKNLSSFPFPNSANLNTLAHLGKLFYKLYGIIGHNLVYFNFH